MDNIIAINASELATKPGEAPEWIKLIPAGSIVGRDGRSWVNSAPEAIIAHWAANRQDLPIDIEHSSHLKAPKGEPAPAVGWIIELSAREGEIWGKAAWNQEGVKLVGDRAYRYISPTIVYTQSDGKIVGLRSVALTNQPNFTLPALNRHQGGNPAQEGSMKAILAALGLAETAIEADAVAKIKTLTSDLATAANRADNPPLDRFVPRADYDTALNRATTAEQALHSTRNEQLEVAVNAAIEGALKEGKITPATADYHRALCRQEGGLAKFTEFCKAAPVIGGDSGLGGKNADGTGTALNAEQQQIAAMFGNTAEDLAKYGK